MFKPVVTNRLHLKQGRVIRMALPTITVLDICSWIIFLFRNDLLRCWKDKGFIFCGTPLFRQHPVSFIMHWTAAW